MNFKGGGMRDILTLTPCSKYATIELGGDKNDYS